MSGNPPLAPAAIAAFAFIAATWEGVVHGGDASPPTSEAVDGAIARGVEFLLADQNSDGSWGTARRTKRLNIYAPAPGAHHAFRAAVTALGLEALIEAGRGREDVEKAIARGEEWLLRELPRVRRADGTAIYNVWSHAYAIQALVRLLDRHRGEDGPRAALRKLIDGQIDLLGRYESVDGGWGYYDFDFHTQKPGAGSTSFVNATVLVAFHRAKKAGFSLPAAVVERALAATERQRKSDHSYLYGEYLKWRPMQGINRPGGSLGRSQACNVALRYWGKSHVTDAVLDGWLQKLADRNLWLEFGRKRPIPHESYFQVAAYFFYYGHYYGALALEELPLEARRRHQDAISSLLLPLQEKDGSWWDFPFYDYHQPYGTAFALMTLARCRRGL